MGIRYPLLSLPPPPYLLLPLLPTLLLPLSVLPSSSPYLIFPSSFLPLSPSSSFPVPFALSLSACFSFLYFPFLCPFPLTHPPRTLPPPSLPILPSPLPLFPSYCPLAPHSPRTLPPLLPSHSSFSSSPPPLSLSPYALPATSIPHQRLQFIPYPSLPCPLRRKQMGM